MLGLTLTRALTRAGPTCVRHLADWAAGVIRVAPHPSPSGTSDGFGGARDGCGSANLRRSTRATAPDLENPAGHAAFPRLARTAGLVVESRRVAVKHRLKVAGEDLAGHSPRRIGARLSGFAQAGAHAHRGGVEPTAQGMGGPMSITGESGRVPFRVGVRVNALTAGNLRALGVGLARCARERAGRGRRVHTARPEARVFVREIQPTRFPQTGNDRPVHTPMGVFPSADGRIGIAASSPKPWEVFRRAAGREDWLAKPEWQTARGRTADRAALNAATGEATRGRPSAWWIARRAEAGIPRGPIEGIREVFEDAPVRHPGKLWNAPRARPGEAGWCARRRTSKGLARGVRRGVPALGEHADEVLREAGMTDGEIARLRQSGALGEV